LESAAEFDTIIVVNAERAVMRRTQYATIEQSGLNDSPAWSRNPTNIKMLFLSPEIVTKRSWE
jgi:hypothetical protein